MMAQIGHPRFVNPQPLCRGAKRRNFRLRQVGITRVDKRVGEGRPNPTLVGFQIELPEKGANVRSPFWQSRQLGTARGNRRTRERQPNPKLVSVKIMKKGAGVTVTCPF